MDQGSFRRWARCFWLSLAALAGLLWVIRLDSVIRHGATHVTTGLEEVSLFNLSQIRHGEPAYCNCFSYPYPTSLFNWLFYAQYGAAAGMLNPSEESLPLALRLVTLVWAIGGFLIFWYLLTRVGPAAAHSPDAWAALGLSVVAWFGLHTGWWPLTVRPDVPAAVCQLAGLALVLRGGERLTWVRALAAGGLFFAGWGFKPSAVGIFAGTALALAVRGEWRSLGRMAAAFGLGVGATLAAASRAYFQNVFGATTLAPFTFAQFQGVLQLSALTWGPLLLFGVVAWLSLGPAGRGRVIRSRTAPLLAVVFAVALLANGLAAFRKYSSTNYLFETWFVGMLLTGVLQGHAAACPDPGGPRFLVLGLSAGLLMGAFLSVAPFLQPRGESEPAYAELLLRLPDRAYSRALLDAVRASRHPVLCDDSFLARQALGSGARGLPIIDHSIYWDALRAGRITDGGIAARIRDRYFATVWTLQPGSLWEHELQEAGYVLARREGAHCQYVRPGEGASLPRESSPPCQRSLSLAASHGGRLGSVGNRAGEGRAGAVTTAADEECWNNRPSTPASWVVTRAVPSGNRSPACRARLRCGRAGPTRRGTGPRVRRRTGPPGPGQPGSGPGPAPPAGAAGRGNGSRRGRPARRRRSASAGRPPAGPPASAGGPGSRRS